MHLSILEINTYYASFFLHGQGFFKKPPKTCRRRQQKACKPQRQRLSLSTKKTQNFFFLSISTTVQDWCRSSFRTSRPADDGLALLRTIRQRLDACRAMNLLPARPDGSSCGSSSFVQQFPHDHRQSRLNKLPRKRNGCLTCFVPDP